MPTSRELLPRRARETFGLDLSAQELERIDQFVELLNRWASRVNLVAARSAQDLIDRHVLDSLALTTLTRSVTAAADLGSGAGFPGILMAITAPRTRVHLFESRLRRVAFLKEAVRVVDLANVNVWPIRGERWQTKEKPELVAVRGLRSDVAAAAARSMLTIGGTLALMRKQTAGHLSDHNYEEVGQVSYRLPRGEEHEIRMLRLRSR